MITTVDQSGAIEEEDQVRGVRDFIDDAELWSDEEYEELPDHSGLWMV